MTKQRRNQLIAISALIVGLVFLYQPYSVLLRGVALAPADYFRYLIRSSAFQKSESLKLSPG